MQEISNAVFPYLITALGFLVAHILNGIKKEIGEIKTSVAALEKDVRDKIAALSERVTAVETRCNMEHGE